MAHPTSEKLADAIHMSRSQWLTAAAIFLVAMTYQFIVVTGFRLSGPFYLANTVLVAASLVLFLLGPRWPVSLHQIVFLFYFIFFGIVPPLEMTIRRSYWGGTNEVFNSYTHTMILGLVGLAAFQVAYALWAWGRTKIGGKARAGQNQEGLSVACLVLTSVIAVLIIYAVNSFSIESVFTRNGTLGARLPLGQIGSLAFQYFIYPIPCVCLVLYAWSRSKYQLAVTLVLAAMFLVANPITGMSRAQGASMYLAVAASFLVVLLRQRYVFSGLIFCGLFLAFPLLHLLRYSGYVVTNYRMSLDFLTAGHFDSFQMFAYAVHLDWVSGGRQLLGTLLFFVPRNLWPSKPIGTGAQIGHEEGFSLTNVSMNFMGEGYANFGLWGVVLFMAALGWIFAEIDHRFWYNKVKAAGRASYLLLLGLAFFILRGDLLSSFAFTCGMMASVLAVSWAAGFAAARRRPAVS